MASDGGLTSVTTADLAKELSSRFRTVIIIGHEQTKFPAHSIDPDFPPISEGDHYYQYGSVPAAIGLLELMKVRLLGLDRCGDGDGGGDDDEDDGEGWKQGL